MSNLQQWQQKIQAKRKQTPWRQFMMEIVSWKPVMFYRNSGMISIYPPERVPKVYRSSDYNTSHSEDVWEDFFKSFDSLITHTWYTNLAQIQSENCDYADTVVRSKNAYLSSVVINECENVVYSSSVKDKSANVFNSMMVWKNSENVYHSRTVISWFNIFYSNNILNSNNIWFSSNLVGCAECIKCDDLENKSYCFENKEYSKEEYTQKKAEFLLTLVQQEADFYYPASHNIWGSGVQGQSNIECFDVSNAYFSYNTKNAHNIFLHGSAQGSENSYDCFTGGSPYSQYMYGVMGAGAAEHVYCSVFVNGGSSNIYYCINMEACSFCLGCIGLQNKSYCILNKQYSKEERYDKVNEIFWRMETDWVLWLFFPWSLNPFYFNDTAAYLIDPSFTKEEVTVAWYLWRDEPIKVDIPIWAEIVKVSELGQFESRDGEGTWTIDSSILKKVIVDEQGNSYRIVKMEYDFLVKHSLPLPRKHRLERMKENFRIN
jgi:hypothetical protein